jgi:ABC-type transport system involved in multi-copper enzyme maturation permease subunit
LVLGVLYFSTFAIPWLILLVGYNRISEDVQTKYTRFLLQRVHRGAYLAGKIAGHWVASLLAIIVVHSLLLAYAAATDRFDVAAVLKVMPRVWLSMALFVLAYSTFTCMVSSVLQPPFLVLLIGTMLLFTLKFGTWARSSTRRSDRRGSGPGTSRCGTSIRARSPCTRATRWCSSASRI